MNAMTTTTDHSPSAAFEGPRGWVEGVRYGFMAFPLAFVALLLYVLWPNHFARAWACRWLHSGCCCWPCAWPMP